VEPSTATLAMSWVIKIDWVRSYGCCRLWLITAANGRTRCKGRNDPAQSRPVEDSTLEGTHVLEPRAITGFAPWNPHFKAKPRPVTTRLAPRPQRAAPAVRCFSKM